jgi:tetratricopeptide (TPR) repeat protein
MLLSSVFCLLPSVFFLLSTPATASFEYTANCQQAMQSILDLKTRTAREIIEKEKAQNPQNGYTVYLEHYCESVELIVTEDIKTYEKIINSYEDRMAQMDKLDDGSPVNSWLQAEMLFQTGLAQVKFGTRINGVYKMMSAYERIKEHRKKYPAFWQNQKLTGIYNIILSNIPPFMRWAADIFGYSGDSGLGLYQLEEYNKKARNVPGLAEESVILTNLGFLLAGQEEDAFKFMSAQNPAILQATLVKYNYANSASFVYKNDITLQKLSEIHQEDLQVNFYALPYATGRCKLNHLEMDAISYLEKFLSDYTLEDYKKAACNRLSYAYLIQGNMEKYREYREKVFTIGQALRDRDNEAMVECSDPLIPHVGLLKARLLCDGGYFAQADSVMKTINPALLGNTEYLLEYHYRKGRILQLTGKTEQAIAELSQAFDMGKSQPYTYACRSALQLGVIYEKSGNFQEAMKWYQDSVDTYNSTHTSDGVQTDAEKGIKRMRSKV